MAMSPSQARVIDPILSNHARGYSNSSYIGDGLFPIVTMPTRAAKRIEFGREAFRRYNTRRAPGGRVARLEVGYEGKPVSLSQFAIGASTPYEHVEEANEVPGIDLLAENTNTVLAVIALEREIQQATLARDATKYANTNKLALAGGARWSADTSTPNKDVETAKEVIRSRTGRRPNTLELPAKVASVLRVHPLVLERFKHTTSDAISNSMLAQYFDIPNLLVGDAIYDADDGPVDVWGTDVVLAYVPPVGERGMRVPSYGYTYRLKNHPYVEPVYWDKDTKSHVNDVTDEWSPEMVGADAGFLFQTAVAG